MVDGQTKANGILYIGNSTNMAINNSTNIANTISFKSSNYRFTKEDIDNFFASDKGEEEDHTLEESICRPLIGKHNYKPFFYYCKLDPKVENINLKSIEDHIRLDPERHKAKLLEYLEIEKGDVV